MSLVVCAVRQHVVCGGARRHVTVPRQSNRLGNVMLPLVRVGLLLLLPLWIGSSIERAAAAEICFRPECQPTGALVHLGDLATILGADTETARTIAQTELFPAPPAGTSRTFRARQIGDLLRARGVNVSVYRLAGASQVTIRGTLSRRLKKSAPAPGRFAVRRAETRVREAILQYLRGVTAENKPWQVRISLDARQTQRLAATRGTLHVEGDGKPRTGRQVFMVGDPATAAGQRVRVAADVTLPPSVVVAIHALPAGTIIRATDVRLAYATPELTRRGRGSHPLRTLDQVVGLETVRGVMSGQMFDVALLRQPVLVRRNEVVTVYARAAGIRVRTNARAREDGSRGDLVMVESLADRHRYFARVTGIREVDVHAGSVRATTPTPATGELAGVPAYPRRPGTRANRRLR